MESFEATIRRGGTAALREASRFFVQGDAVYDSLREITRRLSEMGEPYAVVGGMALVAHGYLRTTEDVDILITPDGVERVHESLSGLGYVPLYSGSKHLRDTRTGVRIEWVLTGQFPGDGKPKPVSFPDPSDAGMDIDGIRYVSLRGLIELKLASGMTHPGRLRDLADVQELIRVLKLPPDYGAQLHSYVRAEFERLAVAVRESPDVTE